MKERIEKLIDEEIELKYRDCLKALIKPSIRVITKRIEEKLEIGASKMGGYPDLPSDIEWPFATDDNEHFQFVGQFNCSELSKYDKQGFFPDKGMFYIFASYSEMGKVIYTPKEKNELNVLETHPSTLNAPKPTFFQRLFRFKPQDKVFKECRVEFINEYSMPIDGSFYIDIINKQEKIVRNKDSIFSDDFIDKLYEVTDRGDISQSDNHFQGYADGIQESYKEYEISGEIETDIQKLSIEEMEKLTKWKLFFQLDSDSNAQMMWGDCGRFYFYIHEDDIKAKRFDNIKSTMDCY